MTATPAPTPPACIDCRQIQTWLRTSLPVRCPACQRRHDQCAGVIR